MASSLFSLSSSRVTARTSRKSSVPISPGPARPRAAAVDGLSKLRAPLGIWLSMLAAGDFLTCCGDDRGPRGEKAAWAALEKGVDTGGVAPVSWDGVRPCWETGGLLGVGVDMSSTVR